MIAIGIDLGKNTLHMIGLDSSGAIVLRDKVSRGRIASRLANLPPCLIGIEAGMATHYVARELRLSDTQRGDNMKFVSAAALALIGCLVGFNFRKRARSRYENDADDQNSRHRDHQSRF